MMKLSLLIILLTWAPALSAQTTTPAARDTIPPNNVPTYDFEAYCDQVSEAVGGSYVIRNGCIDQERRARAEMIRMGMIEQRIRDYCHQVSTSVGGSYVIYQGCVRMEIEARDRPR